MRRNLINYLKDFLLIRKKNKLLYEVLKTQSENIKKYPNLYVPVFDYISTCLMIYGRYEEEELQCIKKNLQKLKKSFEKVKSCEPNKLKNRKFSWFLCYK